MGELGQRQLASRMERIGRKVLVLSGKGGVGKSTVATNLAVSLARAGHRVGLLDVDLHGPSVPMLLGLTGRRIGADPNGGIAPIKFSNNLSVVSVGLLLESAGDAVIWRGPMKYNVIRQFLKDVCWGELDYLVIDSPPGTGDEPLAVAQLVGRSGEAVIVTTPQDVAIADVRRSVSFCRRLELPVTGIVENMSGLVCPHCREVIDVFSTGGGEKLAAEMSVPFLGRIPLDPRVAASGDEGVPLGASDELGPTASAIAALTDAVASRGNAAGPEAGHANELLMATNTQPEPSKENEPMKIALPVADGRLCMHFGHCEQFAVVEVDESKSVVSTTLTTPPPHEPGVLPRWLAEQGANVIIAGGMGMRAQNLFAQHGIEVVVGAPAGNPQEIVAAYLAGDLEVGQNVCDH